ncbi:hypothetical protein KCU77_g8609, partial [Aureobasidium melanogenum]
MGEDSRSLQHSELQNMRRYQQKLASLRNKYATDPTWREQQLAKSSIYYRTQSATDIEWRALKYEYRIKHYHLKKEKDPNFVVAESLRSSVYKVASIRERLSWPTHMPILTQEKVERHCASCGMKLRGGMRFWWQRRQGSQNDKHLYDCNSCFWKDPATYLPTGFEDVKTVEQLQKRKEQLLGVKARKPRQKTASPPPST